MDRRTLIHSVVVGLLATPCLARAEQLAMPMIGFVRSSSIDTVGHFVAAFRHGLKETGYVEGQNVVIEFRSAGDHLARLPEIIGELVRRQAAVLVANAAAARAAKAITATVPIVFATGGDPVRDNLVASFNRPGGNVTGVLFLGSDLGGKKLEIIRSLAPKARTIGVLEIPNSSLSQVERSDVLTAAHAVGQRVIVLTARTEQDFEAAFMTLAREQPSALVVTGDALFTSRRDRLVALAARYAVPTIHSEKVFVQAGGLISYGASTIDAYRHVGIYTGRILKGEKPADLPVMQVTKFELAVNRKTAQVLGLTIPPSVLVLADEVIQ